MRREVSAEIVHLSPPERSSHMGSLQVEVQQLRSRINDLEEQISDARSKRFLAELVRSVVGARRRRNRIFSAALFADPAWDMLLELYAAALDQKRLSITKLCDASGVPGTTALRWIDKLQSESLVLRHADPLDGRRIWIELSDKGYAAMQQYFNGFEAGPLLV